MLCQAFLFFSKLYIFSICCDENSKQMKQWMENKETEIISHPSM